MSQRVESQRVESQRVESQRVESSWQPGDDGLLPGDEGQLGLPTGGGQVRTGFHASDLTLPGNRRAVLSQPLPAHSPHQV